ncbi:acyloxyacyl hydrolase [Ramlibacter sp. H39-3-26]|uniref:acyloxyacyl hydrolase n=1 Tax=Curvibacter soli TaxID=3031331 RepID=UPI0023DADBB4|nr:acyloxyacyl hydrolase [Ramlibacter sp. H39-3-26]MDF1484265.1 acyloxyacyl hydrolase [Ramlibacter sp. H39-3-26]
MEIQHTGRSAMRGLRTLAAAGVLLACGASQAQELGLLVGNYHGNHRVTLLYTAAVPWYSSELAGHTFEVVPEAGVSRYSASQGPDRVLYQVHATPTLRYWLGDLYLEGGIGVSLLDGTRLNERRLSTAFLFSDHLGLGYRVSPKVRVGYRFTHVSNASIKQPNMGIDMQQLFVSVAF